MNVVKGFIRTLKSSTESNLRTEIAPSHPLIAWTIEHAAQFKNRCMVGCDGRTQTERLLKLRQLFDPRTDTKCRSHREALHKAMRTRRWLCATRTIFLEDEYHNRIGESRVPNAWLIRHRAWICPGIRTELQDSQYISELVPFGDSGGAHFRRNIACRWTGTLTFRLTERAPPTDTSCSPREGVLCCKSVQQLALVECPNKKVMVNERSTPGPETT